MMHRCFMKLKWLGWFYIILFHSMHLFIWLFILYKTLPSPALQQPKRRTANININVLKGYSTCFPTLRSVYSSGGVLDQRVKIVVWCLLWFLEEVYKILIDMIETGWCRQSWAADFLSFYRKPTLQTEALRFGRRIDLPVRDCLKKNATELCCWKCMIQCS